jgi:hypothetical protein
MSLEIQKNSPLRLEGVHLVLLVQSKSKPKTKFFRTQSNLYWIPVSQFRCEKGVPMAWIAYGSRCILDFPGLVNRG